MKKLLFCLLCTSIILLSGCYDPKMEGSSDSTSSKHKTDTSGATTIVVAGSTTMEPIMKAVSHYFLSSHPNYTITIAAKGSNDGLNAIWKDSAHIAMSSHKMSDSIVAEFRKKKIEYAELLLAGDALVFIVNTNNPIHKLTNTQLEKILTGTIKDWQEVGGTTHPIQVYSRDMRSGSFSFLQDVVLSQNRITASAVFKDHNEDILEAISTDKNAIGYVSFANLDYSINPVSISFDDGLTFIAPREETVNNLKYKYFRSLYLYYKPEVYHKVKSFLDVLKADTVQKIIQDNGYIPLSHRLIHNQ